MNFTADPLIGKLLNQLRVLARIGSGGIGDVYLAHDATLERNVAIKVLNARMASDQNQILRFQREARACARLDHRNIVRVWQVGRAEGEIGTFRYMVMEYVEGINLGHAIRERTKNPAKEPFSESESAEICLSVARALRHAHARSVVHRDIKPANILLRSDREVKVVDFGLAQLIEADGAAGATTGTGKILGTPNYLSPEQARGLAVDGRSDVYSLGITFYEMLSGATPFEGASVFTVIHSHIFEPLVFPKARFTGVSPKLIELIQRMCAKEAHLRPDANQVVKDLESFLGYRSESVSTASISALAEPRALLRRHATSFLGREAACQELRDLLSDGHHRVVSVVGTAGVGKTRLVEESIEPIAKQLKAGLRFADLSLAEDRDALCRMIAHALELELQEEDHEAKIRSALALAGPFVLFLDNAERRIGDLAALLHDWLAAAPELRVVITSREALRIDGEAILRLQPLPMSSENNAAVRLFLDRAREARHGFTLAEGGMADVLAIVETLDGIPLALELAAARVATLSPAQIRQRLSQHFELLRSNRRDSAARAQTMDEAIAWSWEMLAEHERIALAQLSVFKGGFFLDDAEEVLDLESIGSTLFALDVVEGLAERSLLQSDEVEAIPGELRFREFASVREYASLRLFDGKGLPETERGPEALLEARRRHAQRYLPKAIELDLAILAPGGQIASARLAADIANIEAAHGFFVEVGAFADAAPLALVLERYYGGNGPWKGRLPILDATLAIAGASDKTSELAFDLVLARANYAVSKRDVKSIQSVFASASTLSREIKLDDPARLLELAILEFEGKRVAGDFEDAEGGFVALFNDYRDLAEDDRVLAASLARISRLRGLNAFRASRYDAAVEHFSAAESAYRQLGDEQNAATNLNNRGMSLLSRGELQEGLKCLENGVKALRPFGKRRAEALGFNNLSSGYLMAGDFAKAVHYGKRAEKVFRAVGDADGVAAILINLAGAYEAMDDFDGAREMAASARTLALAMKDSDTLGSAAYCDGTLWVASRNFELAKSSYLDAYQHWQEIGFEVGCGVSQLSLGILLLMMGEFPKARSAFDLADQHLDQAQSQTGAFDRHLWRGALELREGRQEVAQDEFLKAEELLAAEDDPEQRGFILAAAVALSTDPQDSRAAGRQSQAEESFAVLLRRGRELRPEAEYFANWLGIKA